MLPGMWPQASDLTSLCFSFLTCKTDSPPEGAARGACEQTYGPAGASESFIYAMTLPSHVAASASGALRSPLWHNISAYLLLLGESQEERGGLIPLLSPQPMTVTHQFTCLYTCFPLLCAHSFPDSKRPSNIPDGQSAICMSSQKRQIVQCACICNWH